MGLNSKQASWDVMSWSQQQEFLQDGGLDMPKAAGQAQNQQQKPPLRCPRCDSTNTKFCYYNNYSRSQPRHFCKACRRYWTEGGTLRNVPVGGGSKNKRQKLTHNTTTPSTNSGSISNNPMLINILHQVMMPYQPLNHSVNSNLLPIDIDSYDNTARPVLVSSSSSSYPSGYPSYRNYMIQQQITGENDLAVTNGVTATSTWREAPALPASNGIGSSCGYWSCWDDDITGLVDAELKQPVDDDPRRP